MKQILSLLSVMLLLLAMLFFATWQYRLLMVLIVVLLNKNKVKSLLPKWRYSYKALIGALAVAIFIAIPNYFQRGRIQLHYLDENGEPTGTPWLVYGLNVIFPEEEVMNMGMKATALLPPQRINILGHHLGGGLLGDAQKDFWTGKGLSFYSPYNAISLAGSNPGAAVISQACNEMFGTHYDGVYVIKPENYASDRTYPVVFFCHGFLGNWELYNGLLCHLDQCIVVCVGTRDLTGIFSTRDIDRIFTKYIPYLQSEGFHVDENNIHLIGLSNGGTASNVALANYSKRFRSITYISTSCDVIKHANSKVLMVGGGKDNSSRNLPSAHKKLQQCGTPTAIFFDKNENHFIMVHKKDEIIDFLNKQLSFYEPTF